VPDTNTKTMSLCPECGNLLTPVAMKTLKHLLSYGPARSLQAGDFFHCTDPDCDIVYVGFAPGNASGVPDEVFRRDDVKDCARPHAAGRDRLICHCFGYTVGEIEDDATSGADSVSAAIAAEVRAGNCACEVKNPSGH
jgi:Zinc binding domain